MALQLYDQQDQPVDLENFYAGRSAFLICGGPSFANLDHSLLTKPGIMTMGVNNSVKTFRPNLWTSVDNPQSFIASTWLDPRIIKFVYLDHKGKFLFDSDRREEMNTQVKQCPAMLYYKRNADAFDPEKYINGDTFWWGQSKENGGNRSVMLVAIRLLMYLGFKKIYLLGVDFEMNSENKYHFEQHRSAGSIKSNNSTYAALKDWFTELRPYIEKQGVKIYNCNPKSGLKCFDFVSYEDAIETVSSELGKDTATERTDGLYDRPKDGEWYSSNSTKAVKLADGKFESKADATVSISATAYDFVIDGDDVYEAEFTATETAEVKGIIGTGKSDKDARIMAEANAITQAMHNAHQKAIIEAKRQAKIRAEEQR